MDGGSITTVSSILNYINLILEAISWTVGLALRYKIQSEDDKLILCMIDSTPSMQPDNLCSLT